jgi:hypothetical protein
MLRLRSLGDAAESVSPPITIYQSVPWASATPSRGTLGASESQQVKVRVNAAGLAVGRHEALVVLTGGGTAPLTLPLTLQVRASDPTEPALAFGLVKNAPNPFNPSTTITFRLSAAGPARIDVYNAAGRRVMRLMEEQMTAGEHQVSWLGVDEEGRAVASGVYYARLAAGSDSDVLPMVLVR